jgi:large subunit ribosomal protein L10
MQRTEKERVVAELTERLRVSESLIVTDYRGLTTSDLRGLRAELMKHGARFTVVKNTLTRRAAEAAGADGLLALLEGPTAIAFIETTGDPVAVAKALSDSARETKILALRGGVLSGRSIGEEEIERLAKLPPVDVLRGQLVGAIVAPITQLVGLLSAPLRDLVGLIDARIAQLQEQGEAGTSGDASVGESDGDAPEAAVAAGGVVEERTVEEPEAAPAADGDGDDAGAPVAETPEDESVAAAADPEVPEPENEKSEEE